MTDTTRASWSDIPLDLAVRILRRLPAHVDRVRFAAVCPQWHTATRQGPLPPPLPLLLLSDATVYSLPGSQPFQFPDSTGTGYTDACGDWMVFSREEGFFLRDPFSNATVVLPPLSRIRGRLVGRDGASFWTKAPPNASTAMKRPPKRITFSHSGRLEGGVLKTEDGLMTIEFEPRKRMHVGDESVDVATLAWIKMAQSLELEEEPKKCKLWLCSPNFIVATIKFSGGKRIAACQAGATSWWSVYMEDEYHCPDFIDMAFHQGKLYALDVKDTLFTIDVSMDQSSGDPWISQIQEVISGPCLDMPCFLRGQKRAYLVESRGVLLAVLRKLPYPLIDLNLLFNVNEADRNEFEVFEADLRQSRWFKVTTIGNSEILFLRRRCSRSVSVSHNALPGDRIFFLDNDDKDCRWYGDSSSCSVYSMKDVMEAWHGVWDLALPS